MAPASVIRESGGLGDWGGNKLTGGRANQMPDRFRQPGVNGQVPEPSL
jgi:hypothetical protein